MNGTIVKIIAGVYTVYSDNGDYVECKAKGVFRNQGINPLVGDRVTVESYNEDSVISAISKRKNEFIRPTIANIDQLIIVLSPKSPIPDFVMVDKLILEAKYAGCEVVLCINKCDLFSDDSQPIIEQYKNAGIGIITISAKDNIGIDHLKTLLQNKMTCFAGQSAVGKSSTLNALYPEFDILTGTLSEKSNRGKHTTRHLEIFILNNARVADTPGFSLLESPEIQAEDLSMFYDEMSKLGESCRFKGCLHKNEPGCAVKKEIGITVNEERYDRYLIILEELMQKRRNKYD